MTTERRPLRVPSAEVSGDELLLDYLSGYEDVYGLDVTWKDWRAVVCGLTGAVRERGCRLGVPDCPTADEVEDRLEVANAIVGQDDAFPRGRRYEILNLDPGRVICCLVLGPLASGRDDPPWLGDPVAVEPPSSPPRREDEAGHDHC